MTFKEAKSKLAQIAPGQYRSVAYKETEFREIITVECSLYTDSFHMFFVGRTWEEAFEKYEHAQPKPYIDEGQPE